MLCGVACWLAAATARTHGASLYELETHTLDNGLRVHLAPSERCSLVAAQVWFGVGAADDPADKGGAAHLLEHLLFKTARPQGGGELAEVVERAGGEVNAWTSLDHTVFHAVARRERLWPVLEALGDTLTSPRFEPEGLERERAVVQQELAAGAPAERALRQRLLATAFLAHPYRRPVIGSAESLARLSLRDVSELYRSWYVAPNAHLVIAGGFEKHQVLRRVAQWFGGLPATRSPGRGYHEPEQTGVRLATMEHAAAVPRVAVAFGAPVLRERELAALELAAVAIEQRSAGLGLICYVRALRDASLLVLEAAAPSSRLLSALGQALAQVRAVERELSDAELRRARTALEVARDRQLETVQGRARAIGWYAVMTHDAGFERVHAERLRQVGRGELRLALETHAVAAHASVVALQSSTGRGRATFAQRAPVRVRSALPPRARPRMLERREVLPGGLVVLVRRDPEVRLVSMRAAWSGGVRIEDERSSGVSALLARVLPRGCGKARAAEVARQLEELGGTMEGVVGRNSVGVAAEWLAESWRDGLALLADCVRAPRFDAAEVEAARQELLDELGEQATRPGKLAQAAFLRALYREHPYHREVLGSPSSLLGLGRNALRAFHARYLPTGGLVLAVVGDVDPDEVVAEVRARFGGERKRSPAAPAPQAPVFGGRPAAEREIYVDGGDAAQAHLVIGFPGATVGASDRLALEVLGAALGGQSGRLFRELRERRALAYQVAVHVTEGIEPGYLAVHVACSPDRLDEAHAAIRAELEAVLQSGLSADEVARARNYVIGAHETTMQRRSAIAAAMAYHELYGLPWQAWQTFGERVATIDGAALAAAARAYLSWDRAVTVTVRPRSASPAAERRGSRAGKRAGKRRAREAGA